jgi:hypothetical protein
MKSILINEDHEVICQNCGSNYLRHTDTQSYWRDYEDGNGKVIFSKHQKFLLKEIKSKNITGRRDCVIIALSCEECENTQFMVMLQHKGCTKIFWKS